MINKASQLLYMAINSAAAQAPCHSCRHAHFATPTFLPHPLQVFLIPVVSCIHEVLAMSLGYFHVASKV